MPRKKVEATKPTEQFEINWDTIKEQVAEAKEMVEKGEVKPAKKPAVKKAATKEAVKPTEKKPTVKKAATKEPAKKPKLAK
jgi:hypothetical protein